MVNYERFRNFVGWLIRCCRWGDGNRGQDEAAADATPADDQIREDEAAAHVEPAPADDQIQEAATETADDQIQEAATAIVDDQIQEQVDHPSLEEQVGVECQGSQEAVAAPPLAAADHPGLQEQVGVECQGGQEAVAAPSAGGGILTDTEEEDEEMMMKRIQKGKQVIVYEEGECSKSKEEEEEEEKEEEEETNEEEEKNEEQEEKKNEKEETNEEEEKKEEQEEKKTEEEETNEEEEKNEEEEGAELTTLRIDVNQGNTSTSVITTVSTTSINFVTESDQGKDNYYWVHHHKSRRSRTNVISLQNGATGRRRVTWSLTVTTMRGTEDTALAVTGIPYGRHSSRTASH